MTRIKIKTTVEANLNKAWDYFTQPKHVMNWNHASEDWECPQAINNLRIGGKFSYTMRAKDLSVSFNFEGVYVEIEHQKRILYIMSDNDNDKNARSVEIFFEKISESETRVIEIFDPESKNLIEMQKQGWQSILDNYKQYTEQN